MKLIEAIPGGTLLKVVLGLIVAGLIIWGGYTVVYRLFIQPMDLKKAQADVIVGEEQLKAEQAIADQTNERFVEREVYRETVRNIVTESREQVDANWNGETVGRDVDAAGAAALCRLRDSFCRAGTAAEVQPLRPAVPATH